MANRIIATSVLEELLARLPHLRSQLYFKTSLTALSHAMEDQVLANEDAPIIIACFQRERFYRQEAHRYRRIATKSNHVYVLAAPETEFTNCSGDYETVAFDPADALSQEWHLTVLGKNYSTCLVCREVQRSPAHRLDVLPPMDAARRFEGIWTFDRQVAATAAELLLNRIREYRPELKDKLKEALGLVAKYRQVEGCNSDPAPFADRLVTYLQAGQYKQIKAYRQIAIQERKERLTNAITTAIRNSLNPTEILTRAVAELGEALKSDRCLIYRCRSTDTRVRIEHEYTSGTLPPLQYQYWPVSEHPYTQRALDHQQVIQVDDVAADPHYDALRFKPLDAAGVKALLLAPVLYQGRLLGIVELHRGEPLPWHDMDAELVEAIATQVGVALIQAEAYADLEELNAQLEALDRTRSNLIAITGHELRTPLSTIQVCLESLASEPDMDPELRQVMLSTALADAERMRKLIQDFLTLSQLESGRVQWRPEPLPLQELVDLALSSLRTPKDQLPTIRMALPKELPLIRADGEWLVEVLSKLLDNACKFTEQSGQVSIAAKPRPDGLLEVTVADTGRGIEPDRLETIFDRFYQEEGALRRSTGGTGLGLAICRQIITNLGGQIWAESAGRDRGSEFHFTIPIAEPFSG
ncbi:ATP-binding protein [Thermosynechococcus sp. HN-54]|uniref:DICT sensory domain-containing protein n=1 Tax=Thermosynechococcus sp. HN-54 TaxID=2933959 RepID=UPI00202CCB5E|nr:DICT sensory domain-containing protein [Thermosynechococcus sp. HN-54]URR36507.1 ATP-binding protein [Thermosynechococcus sp. HN-54]